MKLIKCDKPGCKEQVAFLSGAEWGGVTIGKTRKDLCLTHCIEFRKLSDRLVELRERNIEGWFGIDATK